MTDTWQDCPMCGRHVRCGKCGNNCCNAGTGTLPDGSKCGCDSAYEMQDAEDCGGYTQTEDDVSSDIVADIRAERGVDVSSAKWELIETAPKETDE